MSSVNPGFVPHRDLHLTSPKGTYPDPLLVAPILLRFRPPSSPSPNDYQPPTMKPSSRISLRLVPRLANAPVYIRPIHSSVAKSANVAPIVGTGPPPEPPVTAAVHSAQERVARRRKHAEMLKTAKELRSSKSNSGPSLKSRFWKHVGVKEVDGECICRSSVSGASFSIAMMDRI